MHQGVFYCKIIKLFDDIYYWFKYQKFSDRRKDMHFLGNFCSQDTHKIDDKESNDWLQLLNVWLTPEFDLILIWSNVDAKLFILDLIHTHEKMKIEF